MGEKTGIPNDQMRIRGRCSYVNNVNSVNSEGEVLGCKPGEHYAEEHGHQWPLKRIRNDADSWRCWEF